MAATLRTVLLATSLAVLPSCREPQAPAAPAPAAPTTAEAPVVVPRPPEEIPAEPPPRVSTSRRCLGDRATSQTVRGPELGLRIAPSPPAPTLLAQRCATEAHERNKQWAGGSITVQSRIGPGGRVVEACTTDSTLPEETTQCILRVFVGSRLRGDQGDVLSFPMSFPPP